MKKMVELEERGKREQRRGVMHHLRCGCVGAFLLLVLAELWGRLLPYTNYRDQVYDALTSPGWVSAGVLYAFSDTGAEPLILGWTFVAVNYIFYAALFTVASILWTRTRRRQGN